MINFNKKEFYSIDDLLNIMQMLRSEDGCPWDRVQSHESIKKDFVEEVYEAIEAIDLGDIDLLREELGDVLLQIVFHCQIEAEANRFSFDDVCDEICKKLIIRHPHVFGDVSVSDADEVLENWDNIKKETKGQESYSDTLKSVAKSLPALMRAQKIGNRAMRAGMDFKCCEDTISCVKSELSELEDAIKIGNLESIEEELGDLIFSCVNTARHLKIDAEQALVKSTDKFIRRFEETEKNIRLKGRDIKSLSIDEIDIYWREAKKKLIKKIQE
ncbi:MAG: nucleoside triphosphate pyrophosphohydrolase [Clostridiales bacterium]|nr:nucleoside triphosphate pyrophosphohydrolase [Clostridiales bacterium]